MIGAFSGTILSVASPDRVVVTVEALSPLNERAYDPRVPVRIIEFVGKDEEAFLKPGDRIDCIEYGRDSQGTPLCSITKRMSGHVLH